MKQYYFNNLRKANLRFEIFENEWKKKNNLQCRFIINKIGFC